MGKVYHFHSDLPPDRLPEVLHDWGEGGAHVRVRWKGGRITVTRTVKTRGEGGVRRTGGVGWAYGTRRSWQWNNPFCGRACPDGRGGSVLTGRFRIHPVGRLLMGAVLLWLACMFVFWSPHNGETLLTAAAAAAIWLTLAVRICRNLDTGAGAEEILRYLREHFEEIEG